MAIVSFLLSFLARKANNIIQAVFGWSITALFGRLRRRARVLVTGALVASLAWPLFVLGVVAPRVASWAIAFVPLHHWLGNGALRIMWTALAVITPLGVGLLIHAAAGHGRKRIVSSMLHGYPVALGFFLAFVITVITVPAVKIVSLVRRWTDEHVYVQPREGAYADVLECLAEACKRAGLEPVISDAPQRLVLATTVMRTFARGAVEPFVAERLRRVTAPGVELYLYPGDLLMRGLPFHVARVRAMLGRTKLDAQAYLVDSDEAKTMQDQLSKLSLELTHTSDAVARLQATYRRMLRADVTFDEWIVLDAMARKIERRMIVEQRVVPEALPLDSVEERLPAARERRAA